MHSFSSRSAAILLAAALLGAACALAPAVVEAQPAGAAKVSVTRELVEEKLALVATAADPAAQARALAEVVKLGKPAVPHLLAMLDEVALGWDLRASVVWVLGEVGDKGAVGKLSGVWAGAGEAPGTFRMQVAIALGALGHRQELRSFLAEGVDLILVAKAATGLADLGDTESIPAMVPFLTHEDIGVFIAMALGRLGDARGHDQLKEAVREPLLRDHAAIALGLSGDTTVLYQVRFALDNPDPFVRRDAVVVLGRLKDFESLSRVEALADHDPDKRVRDVAVVAVRRIERRRRR